MLPHYFKEVDGRWYLRGEAVIGGNAFDLKTDTCLLYPSDAADERSSVDLGGRRIIKKKKCLSNKTARESLNTRR